MSTPYLTDDEIASICEPLQMPAAQRRYLASLGLVVKAKPNGRPLVTRAEFDRVLVGRAAEAEQNAAAQPNRAACYSHDGEGMRKGYAALRGIIDAAMASTQGAKP